MRRVLSKQVPFRALSVLVTVAAISHPRRGSENTFGNVYGTGTEPPGHGEANQWVTARLGKESGLYQAWDFNTEFEYGITDRLQASFYLNAARHEIHGVPGIVDQNRFAFRGVQASVKYRFSSPDQGALGLALYVEPGYARVDRVGGGDAREQELETRLLL